MPLIHIYLQEGRPQSELQKIGDTIHQALMDIWGIPKDDRFHLFHEKPKHHFDMNHQMWGVERSDALIVLHIFTSPRSNAMKLNFYKCVTDSLKQNLGVRPDDVFISVSTNSQEDWSFGNGMAQLLG